MQQGERDTECGNLDATKATEKKKVKGTCFREGKLGEIGRVQECNLGWGTWDGQDVKGNEM